MTWKCNSTCIFNIFLETISSFCVHLQVFNPTEENPHSPSQLILHHLSYFGQRYLSFSIISSSSKDTSIYNINHFSLCRQIKFLLKTLNAEVQISRSFTSDILHLVPYTSTLYSTLCYTQSSGPPSSPALLRSSCREHSSFHLTLSSIIFHLHVSSKGSFVPSQKFKFYLHLWTETICFYHQTVSFSHNLHHHFY